MAKRIDIKDLNLFYGKFHAVEGVSVSVPPRNVTAFIGPSGCGKSTFLRSLNRMHEVIPGARVQGKVLLDEEDIYADDIDPVGVRRKSELDEAAERALQSANLWIEVRDRLKEPGNGLSGGQQQRLCIARAI